ncbi:hypothetical protein [Dyella sp. ASV21]|uniref:hypothetical protein n=1 Tax=Dyella sp. ASV21 TaxID=2795114 RepID=UPI0018EACCE2|nr:hypothetical protein [Dyella sp. ASV21]
MKLKLSLLWGIAVAVALPVSPLLAKQPPLPDVKADTRDKFVDMRAQIDKQMQPGGRFEFVENGERATVSKDFDQMQSLFDKFDKIDAMDNESKLALYNDQSEINAILTRRDGDREVCVNEKPTGSIIAKNVCRKYSDMVRENSDTQKLLMDNKRTQTPTGGH